MQLDDAAWTELRRLYCESTGSIRSLATRFGISPRTITNHARKHSWHARPKGAPPPPRHASAVSRKPDKTKTKANARKPVPRTTPKTKRHEDTKPASKTTRQTPRRPAPKPAIPTRKAQKDLVARLYRAISTKLEQMETRMANGEERSAQDEEREARALSTMIRNFEKVTEAATEFDSTRKPAKPNEADNTADAERMRREIAARLEKLTGKRDACGTPRKSG